MHFLIACIIPFFSYLLQTYPRIFNRYFGVDVWTRLIEIDHVRKAKHKIPGKITKGFIIDGYFDYPIFFPWLFSFFPKKFLCEFQGFISPIFDCLQNILVFFIAYSINPNFSFALIAQLVYSLIPMIVLENSYLTPRSLGYFLFTLSFYPLIVFHITHNPLLLLWAALATTLIFITHRFALQSLIFISIFFTFYDWSLYYVINLAIGFLGAMIVTKGYYLRSLKGHWYNIYFWICNYQYRFAHQVFGNQKKKQDWVGTIYKLLSKFSPIFIFGTCVWIVSAFAYLLLTIFTKMQPIPLLTQMAAWVVFFYVLGVIVLNVKKLIPIGEGQRYLEMATVPSAILTSYLFFYYNNTYPLQSTIIFGLLLIGNLGLIIFVQIKGIIQDKNRSLNINMQQVYAHINKLPGTPRILCIPHQITTMTIYNTKADVLVNADNPQLMTMFDFYPVLKKPIKEIAKKYKLNYLLLRESYTKQADLKIKNKVIYSSGDIKLIKLTNK